MVRKPNSKKKLSKKKTRPNQQHESTLNLKGFRFIAGLDEVGRGALAGPVVAAACVFDLKKKIYKIRDSKMLTAKERQYLARSIRKRVLAYSLGLAEVEEIREKGIQKATFLAFERALKGLGNKCDFVLVDGYSWPDCPLPHQHIIKGDQKCTAIAAASILAKVFRDKLMKQLSRKYPGYYFAKNKGYGTKQHLQAIKKRGICEIHRRNFRPIKKFFNL